MRMGLTGHSKLHPSGSAAPPCRGLGTHCRSLPVTLRVGSLEEGSDSLDHEATWLIGHTQNITFSDIWEDEGELYVDAVLHVPCRYLREEGSSAGCTAYGFKGPAPRRYSKPAQPRRLSRSRFLIVENRRTAARTLAPPPRSLPVLDGSNPCALAPCRTADNLRGAACCRDLQIEIMCTRRQRRLEALVRSRRPPYLCKVTRAGDFSIEAEVISACGYLDDDGIGCSLHGRLRADGRPAKPDLCSDWPPKNQGLHPGCVFAPRRRRPA
ncbi:MAG: hypothetical protein ACREMZ_02940 [Gemmatimonadales bacterium]